MKNESDYVPPFLSGPLLLERSPAEPKKRVRQTKEVGPIDRYFKPISMPHQSSRIFFKAKKNLQKPTENKTDTSQRDPNFFLAAEDSDLSSDLKKMRI